MAYFATGAALSSALAALPTSLTGSYKAFDAFYYAAQYMGSYSGTLTPIEHFVQVGAARGYQPNADFNPAFYASKYSDLAGLDAADLLFHYVKFGLNEGRAGNATLAAVNWADYLAAYPAVATYVNDNLASFANSTTNGAIAHYVKFGAAQGFTIPNTVGQTFTLTAAVDSGAAFTGTSGNDTFTAGYVLDATGTPTASFTIGDAINGGAGTDTLKVIKSAAIVAGDVAPVGATLTSIENLEITSGAGLTAVLTTGSGLSGVTQVTSTSVGASALTSAATQDVTMTVSSHAAAAVALEGGKNVSVTTTGQTTGNLDIGATTSPAGTVTVATAGVYADGADNTLGTIGVTGGTTINVTSLNGVTAAQRTAATTDATNNTITQGAVTVTGKASTTSVSVTQSAAVAEVDSATVGKIGEVAGGVTVNDANRASATAAGTITTVSLTNAGAATVNSGALTTLNLGGTLTTVNAGTLGALTTAANTALAVNLTGAVTTGAVTIDTDITTININGAGTANTIASLVDASATAVNVAGSVGVTISAQTLAAAAVITSTNTAGTTLSAELAVGQQFVGGAGADTVAVGATTKAINMGDGNDVVIISTETLGTGGTINGGAGTNTIVANTNTSTLSGNANITGFTTLRVAGGAAAGAHNATGFTALEVGALNGASSFTNVAAGTTLKYLAAPGQTTAYTLANATGTSDVLAVTISSAAAVNAGTLTAAGIETVNITTTDTNTTAHQDTLALVATSATRVTVTGNAGLAYTNTGNVKVGTFDASGVTGAAADAASLAVTFTSVTTTANSATMTINGGSGNDTLTGGSAATTNTADTINGGAGNDIIDGGTGADVIDGGTGTNTLLTAGMIGTAIEGLNTGTSTGVVVNLGTTAITAATINTALTGTVGISAALASVAAGKTALVYATQDALFSTVSDTITNIQNVTGTGGADYIVGSAVANVITGGAGADVLTGGAGADTFMVATGASGITLATADTITDFVTGSDLINSTSVDGDVAIADGTALANFAAFATNADGAFQNAAAGDEFYIAWNAAGTGNAWVAIDENNNGDFDAGDTLIILTGINLAAEIAVADFI